MSKEYEVSDAQYEFLRKMRVELNPLDENADGVLCKVLEDREYDNFQRNVIMDLRARWIREQGLHADPKWENEINRINRK